MLNARGIRLVMRCDTVSGGWRSVRQFIRSQQTEATVMLRELLNKASSSSR
jgi:precorrin-6B methylase 1